MQSNLSPSTYDDIPFEVARYGLHNEVITHSIVSYFDQLEVSNALANGKTVDFDPLEKSAEAPNVLVGSLDNLEIQGLLTRGSDKNLYQATERGKLMFAAAGSIREVIEKSNQIKDATKFELGMENSHESDLMDLVNSSLNKRALTANLLLAANTLIHESDPAEVGHIVTPTRQALLDALVRAKIIPSISDSPKIGSLGEAFFKTGGYSVLGLSYSDPYSHLFELHHGSSYGPNGNIKRDAELNARGSNGILEVRVAPYLVEKMQDIQPDFHLDFGSGGGDMSRFVVEKGPNSVQQSFGMDMNPLAISESERLMEKAGHTEKTTFSQGSIAKREDLIRVRSLIDKVGLNNGVASINFILHDVGLKLAKDFLTYYKEIFPTTPLMITESMKMPLETLIANPLYMASSFEFMHAISFQHLFEKSELMALLADCGYRILDQKAYSSMPKLNDPTDRIETIVTFTTMPN